MRDFGDFRHWSIRGKTAFKFFAFSQSSKKSNSYDDFLNTLYTYDVDHFHCIVIKDLESTVG